MTNDEAAKLDAVLRIARVARILRTFYQSPISISALQPVLDLAVELNPDLEPTSATTLYMDPPERIQ